MSLVICSCVLVAILLSEHTCAFASGFGYELIQERLDNQQTALLDLSDKVDELRETIQSNHRMMEMLVATLEINLSDMLDNHIRNILKEFEEIRQPPEEDPTSDATCQAVSTKKTGLYKILLSNETQPTAVICEMEAFDGGWMVIQQRLDGTESFHRNWTQYRQGFGTIGKFTEFWAGLESLYQLTKQGSYELAIELKNAAGEYRYSRYSEFAIGSEAGKYALVKLGEYSGTAGDCLTTFHKGAKFSTFDSDNDANVMHNYAAYTGGGWWINSVMNSNLNGPYVQNNKGYGVWWSTFSHGLKYSRMMIRRTT